MDCISFRDTDADRDEALGQCDILDSAREQSFDDLVGLAVGLTGASRAFLAFRTPEGQWIKSAVGLDVETLPLGLTTRTGLYEAGCLVVSDVSEDARAADDPVVQALPGARFCAAALIQSGDVPVGSLCVVDDDPRPDGLTPAQTDGLLALARQVSCLLSLRAALAQERAASHDAKESRRALQDSEARFRAIADSMPQMVWATLPDGFHDYYNARWYEFTGVPEGTTDGEGWNDMFHPRDRERAWAAWNRCLETGEEYEIEYRLRHHSGAYRWVLGRARPIRDEAGRITRWFGTCTDIDELRRAQEGRDLLSQELSHRIKNIFAVVSALIALSAREYPEARPFARAVRDRIAALARAHEFVRPHTEASAPAVGAMTLHAFLAALFRPYAEDDGTPRVQLTGEDASFDDQAATSVALLFHELATNAAKYGALSTPGGRIELNSRRRGDRFILTWCETGGPPIDEVPVHSGFGASLTSVSVESQLGGTLTRDWKPGGLVVVADVPATSLSRRRAALRSREPSSV